MEGAVVIAYGGSSKDVKIFTAGMVMVNLTRMRVLN